MTSIPLERYYDATAFEEDIEHVFMPRMFVGHDHDVRTDGEHFAFQLGRRQLSLRRQAGQVTLNDNLCAGSVSLIDKPGFGRSSPFCPVHQAHGATTEAPSLQASCAPPAEAQRPTIDVAGFHFVADASFDSQRQQEIADLLRICENTPARLTYRGRMVHQCNWKLVVENVLEGYHLSYVHANSFDQLGFSTTCQIDNIFNRHDSANIVFPHARASQEQFLKNFPDAPPSYKHVFIYPNLFISTANDLVYYIGNIVPVAPDQTILHFRLYATDKLRAYGPAVQRQYMAGAIEFNERVLTEDRLIVEACQLGVEDAANGIYSLGSKEERVSVFHRVYLEQLGQALAPAA